MIFLHIVVIPAVCRFSVTTAEVAIAVADITGGGSLPSSFPLANAFPFSISINGVNPAFLIAVNFHYPAGVGTTRTVLPQTVTVQAIQAAASRFANATNFNVLFVRGVDLSFFYRNRLIIIIVVPIVGVILIACCCAAIIGM